MKGLPGWFMKKDLQIWKCFYVARQTLWHAASVIENRWKLADIHALSVRHIKTFINPSWTSSDRQVHYAIRPADDLVKKNSVALSDGFQLFDARQMDSWSIDVWGLVLLIRMHFKERPTIFIFVDNSMPKLKVRDIFHLEYAANDCFFSLLFFHFDIWSQHVSHSNLTNIFLLSNRVHFI